MSGKSLSLGSSSMGASARFGVVAGALFWSAKADALEISDAFERADALAKVAAFAGDLASLCDKPAFSS